LEYLKPKVRRGRKGRENSSKLKDNIFCHVGLSVGLKYCHKF
jgi:hypothetical protein